MKCPNPECDCKKTQVLTTMALNESIVRTRQCLSPKCKIIYETVESKSGVIYPRTEKDKKHN